jgi:hypothetical protein
MRRWRTWAIVIGVAVALVLGVVGGAYAALFAYFYPAPPNPAPSAPGADALTRQREDLAQLARLVALDRAYSPVARRAADAEIAALASRPDVLPPPKFRLALMRIAALADNGHTGVFSGDNGEPNDAPIRLYAFADGVRVVRARAPDADLLGAELTGVAGRPAEAALATLDAYRGGTAAHRRLRSVTAVTSPEMLYGAGLTADPNQATYTFRLTDGRTIERTLAGEPQNEKSPDISPPRVISPQPIGGEDASWRTLLPVNAALPLSLADADRPFRLAWPGGGCIAYVQLRANNDTNGQSLPAFLKSARRELEQRRPCGLVFDLRYDGGGDYTKTASFAPAIARLVPPPGRIAMIVGPNEFSAGITTAGFTKDAGGDRVTIVGEPVGDRLDFYAEGGKGCLPHANLCFHYATGRHHYDGPCNDWRTCFWLNWLFPVRVKNLDPDVRASTTFADYLAGRDLAFDRALTIAQGR